MKKTDRRVKKTEKALAEALSTLLVNLNCQIKLDKSSILT